MILQKWNYNKHAYENYEVSDNWICKCYSNNMDEIVNCPHCGKQITFGEGYTSMEIHTDLGFGYAVCEKCHNKEFERKPGFTLKEVLLCQTGAKEL